MNTLPGAVLTADEIRDLSAESKAVSERLVDGLTPANLKGAAYDLRMADDGMVLPSGQVIKPGEGRYRSSILLGPGQTVFVSTLERVNMPQNLTGNMSIKGELAREGVLSLTGLIVDPGYHLGGSGDGRLHFRLANLGSRPVLLQPGRTRIASIQFLRLGAAASQDPGHSFDDVWSRADELTEGLGFIEDLRQLQQRTSELEAEAARQARTVNVVVIAALFVVITTLLGVAVAGLLSLGNDSHVVNAARAIVPNERGEQIFVSVSLFGLAAIVFAVLSPFRVARNRRRARGATPRAMRDEALRDLRMERVRQQAAAGVVVALMATAAVATALEHWVPWYVSAALAAVLFAIGLWRGWTHVWSPIPTWKIDARLRAWEADALERSS